MDFRKAQSVATQHAPSDYYVEHYRDMERMYLPALFDTLDTRPPGRVLEIGPGWGTTAVWLADKGHDVVVMDLLPVGTFMTQDLLDAYGIEYVHHDIEDSPSPSDRDLEHFDLVIMTQVLQHLAWRPDRTLRHIGQLMGEDAEFVTSVLDRKNYRKLDSTFGNDWMDVPEWGTTERCEDTIKCMYTKSTFAALLRGEFDNITLWKPRRSTVLFAKVSR